MSASASNFLMPDTQPNWKLWRSLTSGKSEDVESPAQFRDTSRAVVVGLPATACRSIGLILPAADADLLPSMVESQLERRGVAVETSPSPNFAYHVLGQDTTNTVVSVDVLASPFPESLAVPNATNYTAALRLLSLPPRDLVLVEEQGHLVLVANHQGRLWQSMVVGTAEMPVEDLVRELEIAKMSFESLDGFGVLRGITVVGAGLASLIPKLRQFTPTPIESVSTLEPARSLKLDDFPHLLPPAVFEAQAARARRGKMIRISFLAAILYALIFAWGFWHLNNLQKEVTVLQDEVNITDEPAGEVKRIEEHWKILEPATQQDRYPVLLLSQITSQMPPSGVVIKRFETKQPKSGDLKTPDEINITGDARDAQTATQFLQDLQKDPKLNHFNWTMPVPSVKEKTASFKIQGKLITS